MAGIKATFTSTDCAFHIEGYEKIDFSLLYVNGAFKIGNPERNCRKLCTIQTLLDGD